MAVPGLFNTPSRSITNGSFTGGTISRATIGPTNILPPAFRRPNANDDSTQGHVAGSIWIDQDGGAWTCQRNTAGAAWWAPGIGVQTGNAALGRAAFVQHGLPLLGDVLGVAGVYGTRKLVSAYAGKLVNVTRMSDGANSDFGFLSDGSFDTPAFNAWGANDIVRVAKVYDQSGGSFDATAVHAPLVLTTTGNNTFADTTGVAVNDHVDYTGNTGKVDTYVTALTGTTITTNNGTTIASGRQVMFSKAPLMIPGVMTGNSPSIILDTEGDTWNITQQLTMPVGMSVTANACGIVMVMRANTSGRAVGYFSLAQTGATGQALSAWTANGNTLMHTFDIGSSWNGPFSAGIYGGTTPHVVTFRADVTGQAFRAPMLSIDDTSLGMGFAGGGTVLTGGYIGATSSTGVPSLGGGVEFSAFVVYSANPTNAQISAAQAAAYQQFGIIPQRRQYKIAIGGDSLMQGPENVGIQSTPRQLADLMMENGAKIINYGWTGQTNVYWNTNFTAEIASGFSSAARVNLAIWYPSNNDYPGTASAAAYFTATMIPFVAKFLAAGYKVLLCSVPSMNFDATHLAWIADCNARAAALAASTAGVSFVDVAADPAFAGTWYLGTSMSRDGTHPTNLASSVWVDKIYSAALALLT